MSLVDQSKKPLTPQLVVFLRSQQCGFSDGFPQVCCTDINTNADNFSTDNSNLTLSSESRNRRGKSMAFQKPDFGIVDEYFDLFDYLRRRRNAELNDDVGLGFDIK